MDSPIYIALAADENYTQHMAAVTLSVLHNATEPQRIFLFFLDAGIREEDREELGRIVESYGARHAFIRPDTAIYSNITTQRYGVAALFRLSLETLLPQEVERVIYLDCDVLVFADLTTLWQTDLGPNIVGAVTNLGHQPTERLGIAEGEYFNSGVLLIDLHRWREEGLGKKVLSYMVNHNEKLIFPDQDGLNCILKGRWQPLPLRWNAQPAIYSMYHKKKFVSGISAADYHTAITNPGIMHFVGEDKPWHYMSFHPMGDNYWAYLADSPWKQARPVGYSFMNWLRKNIRFEKQAKRLLRRLSIPKNVRNKGF